MPDWGWCPWCDRPFLRGRQGYAFGCCSPVHARLMQARDQKRDEIDTKFTQAVARFREEIDDIFKKL